MSWAPSPASARLSTSYREVAATMLHPGIVGNVGRAPSVPSGTTPASSPVPLSFSGGRPTSRQGSFTPTPVLSPTASGLSPNLAQLNIGPLISPSHGHLRGASPAPSDILTRRSFTPLPVMGLLNSPSSGVDDKLSQSFTSFAIPPPLDPAASTAGGTMSATTATTPSSGASRRRGPEGIHTADSVLERRGADRDRQEHRSRHQRHVSTVSPRTEHAEGLSGSGAERRHKTRCPSFNQGPAPITLHVYWQRSVAFDEQGRVVRRLGGDDLTWGKKFLKDVLGVYHVGVAVHGDEYTFGNYHAPNSKQVGDPSSGVYRHDPQRPGPHCVFKQAVPMGTTLKARSQLEDICAELGRVAYGKATYNRIHHNCVDFTRSLTRELGTGDIPRWCYRGAAAAKLLGIGGNPPTQDEAENVARLANNQSKASAPQGATTVPSTASPGPSGGAGTAASEAMRQQRMLPLHPRTAQGAVESAGAAAAAMSPKSAANTASPSNAPSPGSGTAASSGAAPSSFCGSPMDQMGAASPSPHKLVVGRCVSVFQSVGCWGRGQIIGQDADGRYTVQYEGTLATEAGVAVQRIVPHPEVPRETTALAQAFHLDDIIFHPGPPTRAGHSRQATQPSLGHAYPSNCPWTASVPCIPAGVASAGGVPASAQGAAPMFYASHTFAAATAQTASFAQMAPLLARATVPQHTMPIAIRAGQVPRDLCATWRF